MNVAAMDALVELSAVLAELEPYPKPRAVGLIAFSIATRRGLPPVDRFMLVWAGIDIATSRWELDKALAEIQAAGGDSWDPERWDEELHRLLRHREHDVPMIGRLAFEVTTLTTEQAEADLLAAGVDLVAFRQKVAAATSITSE